jgi:hypothetical protein
MKRLSSIFFFATVFCLISISVFAQNVTYLNEVPDIDKCKEINHTTKLTMAVMDCAERETKLIPTTATNYTYKRVMKYKQAIIDPNFGTGYYGGMTSNPQSTGLHYCLLTDYYKTGEVALMGNFVSEDVNCSQRGGFFDGQVVAYYKDGTIKRKEPWSSGKINGVVIFYDEEGNEAKREEYVSGKLIDGNKFSVSADCPLLGTWKFVEYYDSSYLVANSKPVVKNSITVTYYQNGILEATFVEGAISTTTEKRNWKYIPKSSSSGISEEYQGDELVERDSIRWITANQFEATVIFHVNPNAVGHRIILTRQ